MLISRDLFFTSKVTGTAAAMGIDVRVAADAAAAAQCARSERFCCLFIDLADTGLDVAAFFSLLGPERVAPVVAFGSHVATARLQAARDAGCDEVMPRSRFSASLPDLLKKYAGMSSS
ncbi:MAG TPA: hypothetical protein VKU82_01790 [Planctomycetaceae bacterium]|nr:hypothetical protein [Planctomycetaceae bacterium]